MAVVGAVVVGGAVVGAFVVGAAVTAALLVADPPREHNPSLSTGCDAGHCDAGVPLGPHQSFPIMFPAGA